MAEAHVRYLCVFIQGDRLNVIRWDQFDDPVARCEKKEESVSWRWRWCKQRHAPEAFGLETHDIATVWGNRRKQETGGRVVVMERSGACPRSPLKDSVNAVGIGRSVLAPAVSASWVMAEI